MKKHAMNRKGSPVARFVAAGALALALFAAVSPLTAFADEAVEGNDASRDASQEVATTSVTVNYYEGAGYEDEEQTVPIVILRETRTFDGVEVGSKIDPWDYVVQFPDLMFFDGWADNVIADADPANNQVTLKYFRMRWPLTIRYYAVSEDGSDASAAAELVRDAAPAAAFGYRYLGEYQTPTQPWGQVIDSDLLAVPVEGMVHLGADRDEVEIRNVPSENQVNVFYYELPADDAPDAGDGDGGADPAPVPPADTETGSDGAPGTDAGTGDAVDGDSADSSQETVIVEDRTPLAEAAEDGVLPLPQTGDELGAPLVAAAVLMVAAAGLAAILRRRAR